MNSENGINNSHNKKKESIFKIFSTQTYLLLLKKKMKNYILTVIGKLDSDKVCKQIALSLTPVVDSPNLKFQHSSGVLVFHFASEVSKSDVFAYVMGSLYGITESFILTELTDNMTVSFPEEIKEHLLNLDETGENVQIKMNLNTIKKNLESLENDDEEEDWVALLLEEELENLKKPTLDQLLDKILSNGVESLSKFEKKILESYSKF